MRANWMYFKFLSYFAAIFAVDQIIKWIFLNGFRYKGEFIDLVLVFNKGVAFSMFEFFGLFCYFLL